MGPSPLRFPTQNSLHYNSFLDCFKWEIGVFLNGTLRSLFLDVVFSCRGGSVCPPGFRSSTQARPYMVKTYSSKEFD